MSLSHLDLDLLVLLDTVLSERNVVRALRDLATAAFGETSARSAPARPPSAPSK